MFFGRSDWFPIQEYSRIFLARMTAHKIDNMESRFPESLSEAQISEINEKAIPIDTKKAMKFGLGAFRCKVIFLNIILQLLSRNCNANTKQLSTSEFVYKFQNTAQKYKDCNFLLH